VGAKRWVGRDSCVWGLIRGLLERFTGPKRPFLADENHCVRPFARQDELLSGSGLVNVSYPYIVTNDVFESVLMPFIQG
jgi:hypothetical protein